MVAPPRTNSLPGATAHIFDRRSARSDGRPDVIAGAFVTASLTLTHCPRAGSLPLLNVSDGAIRDEISLLLACRGCAKVSQSPCGGRAAPIGAVLQLSSAPPPVQVWATGVWVGPLIQFRLRLSTVPGRVSGCTEEITSSTRKSRNAGADRSGSVAYRKSNLWCHPAPPQAQPAN